MNKKEEGFKLFQRELAEDKISGTVAFYGKEEYLIHWAKAEVIRKYINHATRELDLEYIDIANASFEQIEASILTLPFFSHKRIIVIEGYKGQFKKEIEELAKTHSDNILILIYQGEDTPNKTIKIPSYEFPPLERSQLISFIIKRFKENGMDIHRSYAIHIADRCGYLNKDIDYGLYNLEGDIIKLTHFCREAGEIGMEDIDEILSDTLEHGVFKLIDAIGIKRKDLALHRLNDLVLSGVDPMSILSAVVGQLEIMLQVKELSDSSFSARDICNLINIHEFRVKKTFSIVKNYDVEDIKKMLIRAYNTDVNIKKGIMQPALTLEVLIGCM